jgi:uncharacterized protein
MPNDVWINLPVKDVERSRDFFLDLGFSTNPQYQNGDQAASLILDEKGIILMLFPEATFSGFSGQRCADTGEGTEVLFSIGVKRREEVDEIVGRVIAAGGNVFSEPREVNGWMYGAGFVDLDGHRWNLLHMDMAKIPQRP